MLCREYMKGLKTPKRQAALQFFADHPNETAEGEVSSAVLSHIRNFGLIEQHEDDRARHLPLVCSAWSLTAKGERALALWKASEGKSVAARPPAQNDLHMVIS